MTRQKKISVVTFADNKYRKSLDLIAQEVKMFHKISDIYIYTESQLPNDLYKILKPWLYRRGFGYWRWKAYFVKTVLDVLENGDFLIWADGGCCFNANNETRLYEYIDMLDKSPYSFLAFKGIWQERWATKGDALDYFGVRTNIDIINSCQIGAGVFIIEKTEESVRIIDEWHNISINHPELIDDRKSKSPNLTGFREHRHDQSIFSLLMKINGCLVLEQSEVNNSLYPLQMKRRKIKSHAFNVRGKILYPWRYLIGLYLKYCKYFEFQERIAW